MSSIEDRLLRIEEAQHEIKDLLRQLLPSQAQLDLKNLARKVASGDRQALREFNQGRKGRSKTA